MHSVFGTALENTLKHGNFKKTHMHCCCMWKTAAQNCFFPAYARMHTHIRTHKHTHMHAHMVHICMHVFMHLFMHIFMHICMHICMQMCTQICRRTCMQVFIHICMHIFMDICMHIGIDICMHIFMQIRMYIVRPYSCTCMHICMQTWIQVCIHACNCVSSESVDVFLCVSMAHAKHMCFPMFGACLHLQISEGWLAHWAYIFICSTGV